MKKTFILIGLVLLLTNSYATIPDLDYSDNTVIVVLKPEISQPNKSLPDSFFGDIENATIENISLIHNPKAIEALEARYASQRTTPSASQTPLQRSGIISYQSIYKITLPTHDKALIQTTINILKQNPQIEYATPDYLLTPALVPNDEYYEFQWGLNTTHGIKAPQAWDISTGSQNIRVGVIDSGIASHSDLDANVATGYDFLPRKHHHQ